MLSLITSYLPLCLIHLIIYILCITVATFKVIPIIRIPFSLSQYFLCFIVKLVIFKTLRFTATFIPLPANGLMIIHLISTLFLVFGFKTPLIRLARCHPRCIWLLSEINSIAAKQPLLEFVENSKPLSFVSMLHLGVPFKNCPSSCWIFIFNRKRWWEHILEIKIFHPLSKVMKLFFLCWRSYLASVICTHIGVSDQQVCFVTSLIWAVVRQHTRQDESHGQQPKSTCLCVSLICIAAHHTW